MWKQWVNGVLGLWVILMPYVLPPGSAHQISMVVSGIVIAVLAFWSVSEKGGGGAM